MTPSPVCAVPLPRAPPDPVTPGTTPSHWQEKPPGEVGVLGPSQGSSVKLLFGASKLGWLNRLKNCASKRSVYRSLNLKILKIPAWNRFGNGRGGPFGEGR